MTTTNQETGTGEHFMDDRSAVGDDVRNVNINIPLPQAPNVSLDLDPENGWSEFKERIVRSNRLNSIKYRWMHKEAIKYYSRRRNAAEVSLIVLGSLGTLLSIWSTDVTVQISKVILVLSAFVSILSKFLNYPQLQVQHTVASKKFLELFNASQIQLLAPKRERAHAQIFVQELIKGFTALEGASPEIPKRVRNYLKAHPEVITDLYSFDFDIEQAAIREEINDAVASGRVVNPDGINGGTVHEAAVPQLNPDQRYTQIQMQRFNFAPFATEMSD